MSHLRHPKTTNERRHSQDIDNDDGVHIRGKRSMTRLPNYYDDKPHARHGRSWKNNRQTAYRTNK